MYKIMPRPKELKLSSDASYPWQDILPASYQITGFDDSETAVLKQSLTALIPGIVESEDAGFVIGRRKKRSGKDDYYRLELRRQGWRLSCDDPVGVWYGLQTLRQLLRHDTFTPVTITDYSSLSWRGFMLDCSRHFFPVDEIKRMIDLMLLHKLNRFHWHLTDDQGWRIEIDAYPFLTEVGSVRYETQIGGRFSKARDNREHRGYYCKDEIREIISYAAARGIEVIPEIDIPGHVSAVLSSYPDLSCHKQQISVPGTFGVFKDTLCVGSEEVMRFISTVLTEVAELFPSPWIHIGGDEVPRKQWTDCEVCRAYLEEEGSSDINDLQQLFLSKVFYLLKALGKTPVGWNEILDGNKPDPTPVIHYWNPFRGRRRKVMDAISSGRKVIASDYFHCYLDQSYAFLPLKKAYRMIPRSLRNLGQSGIIGAEAPLWSEWVETVEHLHWQVFPRLTALADRVWSGLDTDDYEDFMQRLETFIPIMQDMGVEPAVKAAWNPSLFRRMKGVFHPSDDTVGEYTYYNELT